MPLKVNVDHRHAAAVTYWMMPTLPSWRPFELSMQKCRCYFIDMMKRVVMKEVGLCVCMRACACACVCVCQRHILTFGVGMQSEGVSCTEVTVQRV